MDVVGIYMLVAFNPSIHMLLLAARDGACELRALN